MHSDAPTVRRATIEDLPQLKSLWQAEGLPLRDEERHLTEFQVVLSPTGELLGAAALHMAPGTRHGCLHSEAYLHPEHEDSLRPLLWARLLNVARNHGLARLWTREEAPFWHQNGFTPADEAALKTLPPAIGDSHQPHWNFLILRDDAALTHSLEKEFELFAQTQRESSAQAIRQAKGLRTAAWIILAIALTALGTFLFNVVKHSPAIRSSLHLQP